MSRPQLPNAPVPLKGDERMRVGVAGAPAMTTVDEVRGRFGRIAFAKTLTTPASGALAVPNVPENTVLLVSPRSDCAIQRDVSRSGTTVTVAFRKINNGTLVGALTSLFMATPGPVVFDLIAVIPPIE